MLSSFILPLLPRTVLFWYSDHLRGRLMVLEDEVGRAERLLDEVEPGYEYSEGFRLHLERKLGEWNIERFQLVEQIHEVENVLFPPST
jgi:hypothetical protein